MTVLLRQNILRNPDIKLQSPSIFGPQRPFKQRHKNALSPMFKRVCPQHGTTGLTGMTCNALGNTCGASLMFLNLTRKTQ